MHGRVVVQFGGLYEAGMHGASVGGLRECDEAVPASVGRPRVVQPAAARAELGSEVATSEQVWAGVRFEKLAHLSGSPVHLERVVGSVAWGGHVELEDHPGTAPEMQRVSG